MKKWVSLIPFSFPLHLFASNGAEGGRERRGREETHDTRARSTRVGSVRIQIVGRAAHGSSLQPLPSSFLGLRNERKREEEWGEGGGREMPRGKITGLKRREKEGGGSNGASIHGLGGLAF